MVAAFQILLDGKLERPIVRLFGEIVVADSIRQGNRDEIIRAGINLGRWAS
jgi:hypothetical protein